MLSSILAIVFVLRLSRNSDRYAPKLYFFFLFIEILDYDHSQLTIKHHDCFMVVIHEFIVGLPNYNLDVIRIPIFWNGLTPDVSLRTSSYENSGIHGTLFSNQIKSFINAVLRRSVRKLVGEAYLCVIEPVDNTVPFEEISQGGWVVGNTESNLTDSKFDSQISRFRGERVIR